VDSGYRFGEGLGDRNRIRSFQTSSRVLAPSPWQVVFWRAGLDGSAHRPGVDRILAVNGERRPANEPLSGSPAARQTLLKFAVGRSNYNKNSENHKITRSRPVHHHRNCVGASWYRTCRSYQRPFRRPRKLPRKLPRRTWILRAARAQRPVLARRLLRRPILRRRLLPL
jgi:hypothetical protein